MPRERTISCRRRRRQHVMLLIQNEFTSIDTRLLLRDFRKSVLRVITESDIIKGSLLGSSGSMHLSNFQAKSLRSQLRKKLLNSGSGHGVHTNEQNPTLEIKQNLH